MKTNIILLTLFLAFSFALPVAAQSNDDKSSNQQTNKPDTKRKGSENEFFMMMSDCKLVGSAPYNLFLKKSAIIIPDESETFLATCERKKKRITCTYIGNGMKEYGSAKLRVIHDEAPNLWFQNKNGTEHWMVDTANSLAASLNVTYLLPENKTMGLVAKLCGGVYLTPSEYQKMKEMAADLEKAEQEKTEKDKTKKKKK